uniref:Adenylate kinase 8 n=1 Tax=Lates calcarifer TaxID=8187 RepID=A0A4W6FMW3_LATCA
MDETVKPLRIPPQMSVYADKHNIFHLVQSLVSSLVIDQPDDPLSYLINLLQRSSVDIPRIILLGPPAVGKHTVATKLSAELRAVHVTADSLLQDQSELSVQARQYTLTQQELPAELLLKLTQQRLTEVDCFNRGWVLEGIPQTRLQALSLQQVGVVPEHVVMLEAPDDVLLERSQGKLVDPLTEHVYHQTFIWPDDDIIAERLEKGRGPSEEQRLAELQRYRCEVTGLTSAYQHVLKVVNSDQPHADVYQQVLAFVRTRRRSRTPRILLLGPPGSGKSHQARLLSEKYKMVDGTHTLFSDLFTVCSGDSPLNKVFDLIRSEAVGWQLHLVTMKYGLSVVGPFISCSTCVPWTQTNVLLKIAIRYDVSIYFFQFLYECHINFSPHHT